MRFLIDEMLSRALVGHLHGRGHPAERASDVGLGGQPDHIVWQHAYNHDQVVVTANGEDFLGLAAGSELHPGLIILRDGRLSKEHQLAWLDSVLSWIEANSPDLLNHVIEVWGPDGANDIDHYAMPE